MARKYLQCYLSVVTQTRCWSNLHLDFTAFDYLLVDILQRLKNRESPPYRPRLNEELSTRDVIQLCENCWSEKPEDRPSASALVAFMRSINK